MKLKYLLPTILMLIFEIAVGVMLLIDGEKFTQVIFILFGVVLLISGLITLIRSLLAGRNGGSMPVLPLVAAIFLIAVGAFFTAASGSVLSILSAVTLVIGIIMAFSGMLKLAEYLALRKYSQLPAFPVFGSIITIILGIVIAFNPFGATQAIWMILGIMIIAAALFDAITLILFGIALKKASVDVIEVEAEEIDE